MLLEDSLLLQLEKSIPIPIKPLIQSIAQRKFLFGHSTDANLTNSLLSAHAIALFLEQGAHLAKRVDITLNESRVPIAAYTCNDGSGRIIPSSVNTLLEQGASLIVNEIDDVTRELGNLSQAIEWLTDSNVWINCYISYGINGAFRAHYDSQDVVALQIKGAKRWFLYGEIPSDTLPAACSHQYLLNPGDFLYVPRGIWHKTQVVDTPSVHLSVSIASFTYMDLVRSSLKILEEEAICKSHVTRFDLDDDANSAMRQFKEQLHVWVESLSLHNLLQKDRENRRLRTLSRMWESKPYERSAKIRIALRRLLQSEQSFEKSIESGLYKVKLGGDTYEIGEYALSILKFMSLCPEVTVAELTGSLTEFTGGEGNLQSALAELMAAGLVFIVS